MKIYTQTGDQGRTSLLSGERVPKSHLRIRAYGEVDELNAVIGVVVAGLTEAQATVKRQLHQVQSDLFQLGAWLSATPGAAARQQLAPLNESLWQTLERHMDAMSDQLPPLRAFILPGGRPEAAWTHLARTVCRRAERTAIELSRQHAAGSAPDESLAPIIVYLNRLSDYFFVLARYLNHLAGLDDTVWKP